MMGRKCLYGFVLAGFVSAPAVAIADGHSACAKCHDADEFQGMSADSIAAAVADASIPMHKMLDLSDEQVQEIAAKLAGS